MRQRPTALRRAVLWLCLASLPTCVKSDLRGAFAADLTLGGTVVPAAVLNEGQHFYLLHCAACHNVNGDGRGSVGVTQLPPPRDLRSGVIKFAQVPAGALPTDADLAHLIHHGLQGTGMQPWRFRDAEVFAVTQYIKTLSPRWLTERPGTPVPMPADPWDGRHDLAIRRGLELYHGPANCQSCHPGYDGAKPTRPPARDTIFGKLEAPDLRRAPLRASTTPALLYRTLAAGIGGVGMETLAARLPPDDIWALVHYVGALRPDPT